MLHDVRAGTPVRSRRLVGDGGRGHWGGLDLGWVEAGGQLPCTHLCARCMLDLGRAGTGQTGGRRWGLQLVIGVVVSRVVEGCMGRERDDGGLDEMK